MLIFLQIEKFIHHAKGCNVAKDRVEVTFNP